MIKKPKILAIIPCYNEQDSIEALLEEFREENLCDVLVIDDGSHDNTYVVAKMHAQVIRLENNQGLLNVIRIGYQYAIDNAYDYCVQIDGDGQHPPSAINKLYEQISTSPIGLVFGSRYISNINLFAGPRRWGGIIISVQLWLRYKSWIADPLSGMRMVNKPTMLYLLNELEKIKLDAMILPSVLSVKIPVKEVSVEMRPRKTGTSHLNGIKGIKFMYKLVCSIHKF